MERAFIISQCVAQRLSVSSPSLVGFFLPHRLQLSVSSFPTACRFLSSPPLVGVPPLVGFFSTLSLH